MANDTRLWCLHHIGADDVHPAPDFETAWKWAAWANDRFADDADICRFTVAVWPWSAERHADGLAASIADWTLPDAPEAKAPAGFDKDWCINMARQEVGYDIGAGELAIDPFTPALTVDETERLRGIVSGLRGALEHLENANEALASKRSQATYLAMEAEARDELIMLDEARRNARAALSDRPQDEGEVNRG